MKIKFLLRSFVLVLVLGSIHTNAFSQDPNFYIYVCFGQSNMEGQGTIEKQDQFVNERFKTFQALDCSGLSRDKENWYTAVPPTCQCWSKLSPADYFGRTMLANLPDSITVGIINVAVGGCDIRLFDKDIYHSGGYDTTYNESWFLDKVAAYNGNPYQYLIDLANIAQKDGVIKGILLHQGETNTGDAKWPSYVKKIYNDMLTDLSLEAKNVPLLAGEVVAEDQGGVCASMNEIINRLPDTIPTAYVIAANGCPPLEDNIHFNSVGYREMGRRYAVTMMVDQGIEMTQGSATTSLYYEAECGEVGENWDVLIDSKASNGSYLTAKEGVEFIDEASTDAANSVNIAFSIETEGYYDIFARAKGGSSSKDSFWVKVDDDDFTLAEGLRTSAWQWFNLTSGVLLTAGDHTLTVGIGENGAALDKININDYLYGISDAGPDAENLCVPDTISEGVGITTDLNSRYVLGQSYPNPATGTTRIDFETPNADYVSLKVYSTLGQEIMELAGKEYMNGAHTVSFDTNDLGDGVYFYTLRIGDFTQSRKMVVKRN